ncbi:hypothetical protein [Streptomyces sp. NPDC020489]|uniref:hypothetical protein n=1 Tax=Streptomyces sp. NPDC020489 TaxID=3365077 RepID=UPI00379FCFCA
MKVSSWDTVQDGERRACKECGTAVRSYQHRFHPPESTMFERCVGYAWCPGCRIYSTAMVHVPREQPLHDALASLPEDRRRRLLRAEHALVARLDRRATDHTPGTTL